VKQKLTANKEKKRGQTYTKRRTAQKLIGGKNGGRRTPRIKKKTPKMTRLSKGNLNNNSSRQTTMENRWTGDSEKEGWRMFVVVLGDPRG